MGRCLSDVYPIEKTFLLVRTERGKCYMKICESEYDNDDLTCHYCKSPTCPERTECKYFTPAVDAAPVVHGHPVYHNRPARYEHYEMAQQTENGEPLYKRQYYTLQDNPVAYCSECGKRMCSRFTSFCPNCGADMREVDNETD